MSKELTKKAENESSSFKLRASENVYQSLASIGANKIVDRTTLLATLIKNSNRSSSILRIFSQDKFDKVIEELEDASGTSEGPLYILTIKDQDIVFTESAIELVALAKENTSLPFFTTEDLLLADLKSEGSLVKQACSKSNVPEPIKQGIISIAKRIQVEEKEGPSIVGRVEYTRPQTESEIKETLDVEMLSDKLLSDLLVSVETQAITTIIADQPSQVLNQLELVNKKLKETKENTFGFQQIYLIDPVELENQPEKTIEQALKATKGQILFIPNLNKYWTVNGLRAAVASKNTKVVTTVTEKKWKKIVTEDLFSSRPIYFEPPTPTEATSLFLKEKLNLEKAISTTNLKISISEESINTAVRLATRYFSQEPLPGGATTLIFAAATLIKIKSSEAFANIKLGINADATIDPSDICEALKGLTGIETAPEDPSKYLDMEKFLQKRIIGQDEAITAVSNAVRLAKAGLKEPQKPIGSFMFLGPTGVGKTELVKALSEFMFDDENSLIRLDMSEYSEKHMVARLIGAPPGYVGYEEGGQLTEQVRRKPYSVVLFDELEKAHPDVLNILLQILDAGRLTDGYGRVTDFSNTMIILTGNVGAEFYKVEDEVGTEKVKAAVLEQTEEQFRPEFLNRLDQLLIFNSLKPENVKKILEIQIAKLNKRLKEGRDLTIELTTEATEFLAKNGYSPQYGVRFLSRTVQNLIANPLANELIKGVYKNSTTIKVSVANNLLVFSSI